MKKIIILLIPFILLISSCPDISIWSGISLSGELTKDDILWFNFYQDKYKIYCDGNWEITLTSLDDIQIYFQIKDRFGDTVIKDVGVDSGSVTKTLPLTFDSNVIVYVNSQNPDWAANNYSAKYSLKGTLK